MIRSEEALESAVGQLTRAAAALGVTRWRDRAAVLGRVGERFLEAGDPLRERALARLPAEAAISPAQARWVLEGMASDWTRSRLQALVTSEFAVPDALDGWVDDPRAPEGRRIRALPLAPGVAVHIAAGSVPGVSTTSLIRGLLLGGPVLLKAGRGDQVLPELFLEGLRGEAETDTAARALADASACAYWEGGAGGAMEEIALRAAGSVVVYGGLETVAGLRRRLAATTPLVEYGHRLSFAVVGPRPDPRLAERVAGAVAAFDQRGCVCPHRIYVLDDVPAARALATGVAEGLRAMAEEMPAGVPDAAVGSAIHQLRGTAALRRAGGEEVELWEGDDLGWTVILDPDPRFVPSCLGRTIVVTPLADSSHLDEILADFAPVLQTVGVDGFTRDEAEALAERVCRLGASRVVPMGRMAFPPAWWLHDGHGPLRRLVRWGEHPSPTSLRAAAPLARSPSAESLSDSPRHGR